MVSRVTDSSNSSVKKSSKKYNSLASSGMIKLNPGTAVNLGRGCNFLCLPFSGASCPNHQENQLLAFFNSWAVDLQ